MSTTKHLIEVNDKQLAAILEYELELILSNLVAGGFGNKIGSLGADIREIETAEAINTVIDYCGGTQVDIFARIAELTGEE